jgi:molybdopterin biosynthesis enzyme
MPRLSPPSHRPRRALTAVAAVALALALPGLAACSDSDEEPTPSEQVATLAQAGLTESYVATYAVDREGGSEAESVTVTRAQDRLRLEISTADGVATSITTPDGTVTCQDPAADDARTTCIAAAGPGEAPPAALDPGLRATFDTSLRTLAAGSPDGGPITVSSTTAEDVPSAGGPVQCFRVEGSSESVDVGTYCFADSGILASAAFASGAITLTELTAAPDDSAFTPPVEPSPLPS